MSKRNDRLLKAFRNGEVLQVRARRGEKRWQDFDGKEPFLESTGLFWRVKPCEKRTKRLRAALLWLTKKVLKGRGVYTFGVSEPDGRPALFDWSDGPALGFGDDVEEALIDAWKRSKARRGARE